MEKNQFDRQHLPFRSKRSRLLSLLGQVIAAFGTVAILGGREISNELYYAGLFSAAIGALLSVLASLMSERERESVIQEKEAQIVQYEAEPSAKEELIETLRRHIKLAVHREEVSMLRAEARANSLFGIGRAFLIASILGPVAAAFLYWWVDPMAPETVVRLKELHQAIGPDSFKGVSLTVARDWRILLAGVSFGLLFLAAARGLLNQQAKEVEIYFRLGEKVNFFERLDSIISIRAAHPDLEGRPDDRALADLVFSNLLHRDVSDQSGVSAQSVEAEPVSALTEEFVNTVKIVKDAK